MGQWLGLTLRQEKRYAAEALERAKLGRAKLLRRADFMEVAARYAAPDAEFDPADVEQRAANLRWIAAELLR